MDELIKLTFFIGLHTLLAVPAYTVEPTSIVIVDIATPTLETMRMPGNVFVGEQIIHQADLQPVQIRVWEADKGVTCLENYPYGILPDDQRARCDHQRRRHPA